mmetsp:Transcript_147/g.427  ORF Transcript_147/g.427 Transcript_147/m.427 type:complete len:339 (+) Transcript_147:101-1117(+)
MRDDHVPDSGRSLGEVGPLGADLVGVGAAVGEFGEVEDGGVGDALEGLRGEEGGVGRDDDVGPRGEGGEGGVPAVGERGAGGGVGFDGEVLEEGGGLLLVDVEADGGEGAVVEGLEESFRVDEAAAADVDEDGAGAHGGKGVGVDEVVGRVVERAVQRDELSLAQQLLQRDVLDVAGREGLGALAHVVGQHAAAHAVVDGRGAAADLAGAHDANGLAVHVEAHEPAQRVVADAHALCRLHDLAVQRQRKSNRVLRDRVRTVRRHAQHEEARGLRGREVHAVEARAPQHGALHAHLRQPPYCLRAQVVVHEQAHRVALRRERRRLRRQPHGHHSRVRVG